MSSSREPHHLCADRRRLLGGAGLALLAPGAAMSSSSSSSSANLPALPGSPAVSLARTHQIELPQAAGRARRLFVAVPEGPVPRAGHPVLWALDGNTLFPLLHALLRLRAARPADVLGPLPIVVGLGLPGDAAYDQAARAEDFTPPGGPAGSGQADRLLDLLTQLQPWLARQLPTDAARQTLFGHSFGGLFVLYALFSRPGLFQRQLAASPSIWWGERAILPHRDSFLQQQPQLRRPQQLLVTAGSLEEGAAGATQADPERRRRQQERRQVSSARELVASLAGAAGSALQAEFRLLEGQDHGSLLLPSAALALGLAVEAVR